MKNTILTLLFIVFLTSCSKDNATETTPPDQLPLATTSGANTAGCSINGKLLIPKNGSQAIGGPLIYGLKYHLGNSFGNPLFNDYFAVTIRNKKDLDGDNIYIHLNEMTQGTGTYILGQSNGNYFTASPNNNHVILKRGENTGNVVTYISNPTSGTISITRFDYPNKIISGTFSFSLYNANNPSEIIQISEGRFDINLVTLNQ
jgi:hypothetical protein